ncbi:hypothetical protein MD484_g1048, partial [Candolleomyces efflorescens]
MKRSQFRSSSEADALRFLHSTGVNLPIPRLLDSFTIGNEAYAIVTRIPGDTLLNVSRRLKVKLTDAQVQAIFGEVHTVIRKLWTLSPPPQYDGLVMCHPSGNGLPFSRQFMEETLGPVPLDELYAAHTVRLATHMPWEAEDIKNLEPALMEKDGKFTGIIDWENSGWHVKHWQLLVVRTPLIIINPPNLSKWWRDIQFEQEVEEAYPAGWELVQNWV